MKNITVNNQTLTNIIGAPRSAFSIQLLKLVAKCFRKITLLHIFKSWIFKWKKKESKQKKPSWLSKSHCHGPKERTYHLDKPNLNMEPDKS